MNKIYHKNASFWLRFSSNLIDLLLIAATIILLWKFLTLFNPQINALKWYSFIILSWICVVIYHFLIPWFWNMRTIGLICTRLQILGQKSSKFKTLLGLSFASVGFYTLVCVLLLVFIMPWQINHLLISQQNNEYPLNLSILARVISTISSFWAFINLVNYALILGSKKRRGIYERMFNFRVVYLKHFTSSQQMQTIKLLPHPVTNIEIIFEKENDGE